jgi:hypothetical protein
MTITSLNELAALFVDAEVTVCEISNGLTIRGTEGRIYHDQKTPKWVFIRDSSWDFCPFDPNNPAHIKTCAKAIGLTLRAHMESRRLYRGRRAAKRQQQPQY